MRSEAAFIIAIDCRFPYDDERAAHRLIDEACSISPVAAFMVLHELARRPRSSRASDETCLALLDHLEGRFWHAAKEPAFRVARRLIARKQLSFDECCAAMREIEEHPDAMTAVQLVGFACEDGDVEAVTAAQEDVFARWERAKR